MRVGLLTFGYRSVLVALSFLLLLLAGRAQAQAPTITVTATSATTLSVQLGSYYASTRIEEKVGSNWSTVSTSYSYSATRAAGIYTFRGYSCYPTNPSVCNYSSSASVSLVGNSPPANPSISASMSGTSVLVSWSAPSGTTSYQLTRNGAALSASGTSYTDASVAVGASYTYTVSACNTYGCSSGASTSITTPTPAPTVTVSFSPNPATIGQNTTLSWSSTNATSCSDAPTTATSGTKVYPVLTTSNWSVPITCTGAGGSQTATAVLVVMPAAPSISVGMSGASVAVSWSAPSGATSYQLTRGGTSLPASGTSYIDSAVTPGTSYTYTVKACNSNGCSAGASASITVTAPVPVNPSISSSMSGSSVYLSWSAPTYTTSYQLVRGSTALSASGTSYTDSGVSAGSGYTYTIKACNASGCSSGASTSITVPLATPSAPTVSASFLGASVSVSWSAPSGTSSYQLQRNGSTLSASGNSYRDTAISTGSYTYTVKACNATGQCSAAGSATVSVSNSAPLFEVNTSGTNTVVFLVGNTYSWHIDEQVGGNWTSVQTGVALGATQSYSITRPAGTYSYRIYNCYPVTDGCSTSSSKSVTVVGSVPPAIPTLSTSMSGTSVLASWNAVSGATSYSLTRNGSSATPTGTSYLDSDVTPGMLYTYLLKACNATGECSAAATSTITPPAIPAVPSISSVVSGADLVVSWSSPAGAVNYQFRRNAAAPTTTTLTSYRETNVTSGATYTYGIKACNSVGQCSSEATVSVSIPSVPAAPVVSAVVGAGVINVSWTAVSGAVNYKLVTPDAMTVQLTGISYSDSAVVAGNTYTYSVKACNVIGDCSAAASKTIPYPGSSSGASNSSNLASFSSTLVISSSMPISSSSSLLSSKVSSSVANFDTDNGIVNSNPPSDSGSATPVGAMAGSFRVDESGSATYSMPIAVPEGVAGVKPQFSIGYNSQGGAGIVGVGANISGVGAVSRCRQTLLQDGGAKPITWTGDDRFCLNGQRLMLVSAGSYGDVGSVYKTEIDAFVKVTAFGGAAGNPDYFEVEAKDGSKTTYGGTTDSRLLVRTKPLNWMQSRFEDGVGNRIDFVYEGDTTTGQRIKSVYYAYPIAKSSGAYAARVEFNYEDRADASDGYGSGAVYFKSTKRLTSIAAYNGSSIYRKYNFYYNETNYSSNDNLSRLTSAEECTSDSVSSCYPKTRFDWGYKSVGFSASGSWMNQLPSANKFKTYRFMDVNGDARQDFVWVRGSGTTRYIEYGAINRYATGGIQKQRFSGSLDYLTYTIAKDVAKAELKIEVVDYNNDGRQDLAVCKPINEYGVYCSWDLYLSVSDSAGGWNLSSNKITLPFTRADVVFGDTNSDGLVDAIEAASTDALNIYLGQKVPGAAASSNQYYAFASTAVAVSMTGTPAVPQTTFPVNSPAPSSRSRSFNYQKAILGDIDGDGRVDLMVPATTETPPCSSYNICHTSSGGYGSDSRVVEMFTYLNTGSGFVYSSAYRASLAATQYNDPSNILPSVSFKPVDFNGDGLTDIASMDGINWNYRLNTGNGFIYNGALTSIISSLDSTSSIEIFDYNRDGFADALWHDKKNKQLKLRTWNSATGKMNTTDTILYSSKPADHSYSVGDMTGDSFADLIELKTDSNGGIDIGIFEGLGNATNLDKIYTITDGNNNITKVTYGSLANSNHYTTLSGVNTLSKTDPNYCSNWTYPAPCVAPQVYSLDAAGFYTQLNRPFGTVFEAANPAPLMEFVAPVYAVTEVAGSAPTAAAPGNLSKMTYHYHHARIQAGGRGYLGFEKITTIEQQSGVKTETTYHQDWPFMGSPKKTLVITKEGNKLSEADNTWASVTDTSNSRVRRVYLDLTTEVAYDLSNNGVSQGNSLQTVVTDGDYDAYGNATRMEVTTSGSSNTSKKITVNTYYPSEWEQRMGRLDTSTSTTQRNSDPAVVRTSKFEYYGQYDTWPGMLKKEIVEPGSNQLVTEYEYDAVGNKTITRKTAQVKSGVSQIRKVEVKYDTSKRFAETTYDSLNNITSGVIARHPIYGVPTQVRDANGVVTTIELNTDGSEKLRSDASGAWSHSARAFCGGTIVCPAGARYRVVSSVSGGGKATEYFDVLGRSVRTSKVMFDGRESHVDTEYNGLGRITRKSEPYFTGDTLYWTTFDSYDLIGRLTQVTAPDNTITTSTYSGYKTTVIADVGGKGLSRIEERNSLGNLTKVTDHLAGTISYGYDPLGNLTSATTAASGKSVVVRMCYDKLGRKIAMHDPDKGGFLGNASSSCAAIEASLDAAPASKPAGWWFYKYNDFGELIEQTDTKRQVVVTEYDALGRSIKRTDKRTDGTVESHTRWYYDKYIGAANAATNTQLKLTGVVTSYNQINESCSGANYCQTYTYDGISRVTDTVTYLPNASTGYINAVKYDTIGRAFKQYDVLHGLVQTSGTRTQFNSYGYPELINDLTSGDVLQKTLKVNARGQVKEELRNNGGAGTTVYTYDDKTGRLTNQVTSLTGSLFGIQNVTYEWDKLGNLRSRWNQSGNLAANGSTAKKNLQESFCYDGLNRLVKSHLGTLTGSCSLAAADQDQEYDGLGNITRKVGMGTYSYTGKGPHAVTSTSASGSYGYDDNGNQINGAGRTITYSSYHQPTKIVSNAVTTEFIYGPDRARFERKDIKPGQTTITHYLGNVERIEVLGTTFVEWKRYIAGAVYTIRTNTANVAQTTDKSFLFNDHLGSLDVVTNAQGKITHSASFDAWGARRSGESWSSVFAASSLALPGYTQPLTQRGYTGHEMLDDHGLIHMNGRIYDAKLARFLQADPFIQAATNTQSYNRYSYVLNNPLNMTDPSGFNFLKKAWNEIRPFIGAIVTIVVSIYCPVCGPVVAGMIGGAVGAAANGGNILQGMVFGAFSGAFGGIGNVFARGFAQGMLGGMQSVMAGGKFGNGFLAAGIGGAAGGGDISFNGFVQSAVLGGIASEITGGKFKNGAASAAFMYAVSAGASKIGAGGGKGDGQTDERHNRAAGVSDAVDADSLLDNATIAEISVGDNTNKILVIDATIANESVSDKTFKKVVSDIEKYYNSGVEVDGEFYSVQVNLTKTADMLYADVVVADARSAGYRNHRVDRFGGRAIYVRQGAVRAGTGAHEFGHLLGLHHQFDGSGRIMSYDNRRSVSGEEMRRLYNAYSR